ncbi:RTA1 like protein-domain-containing protein [Aspergillus pseudodeflectus]|uniref:RTA1 like protein-domain-containing protein n=1 Tax=Aspergillus pseudodeflectus TaxID=176178 RepID=A0ABR4L665_9EURO
MSTANCTSVTPECPVSATTYAYVPNLGANAFFAALFGVCGVYHLAVGVKSRGWTFMIALALGALMEMVGYIGRILMHDNVWDSNAFRQQIVCLILAPSLIAAGIYWSLKHIVLYLGPEHSRLRPNLYPWIFIGCDVGSIFLQAAGGGVASAGDDNPDRVNAGNNIMIAGIAFQVGTMGICGLLGLDFVWRVYKSRKAAGGEKPPVKDGNKFYLFCAAEVFAYVTVLIRCIYRLPEMAGGWGNELMQNELEFLILDGMMVALAVVALSVFHPYWLCPSILK